MDSLGRPDALREGIIAHFIVAASITMGVTPGAKLALNRLIVSAKVICFLQFQCEGAMSSQRLLTILDNSHFIRSSYYRRRGTIQHNSDNNAPCSG
jgi:hypothetical protein